MWNTVSGVCSIQSQLWHHNKVSALPGPTKFPKFDPTCTGRCNSGSVPQCAHPQHMMVLNRSVYIQYGLHDQFSKQMHTFPHQSQYKVSCQLLVKPIQSLLNQSLIQKTLTLANFTGSYFIFRAFEWIGLVRNGPKEIQNSGIFTCCWPPIIRCLATIQLAMASSCPHLVATWADQSYHDKFHDPLR